MLHKTIWTIVTAYLWICGERRMRQHLRHDGKLGIAVHRRKIAAHWKSSAGRSVGFYRGGRGPQRTEGRAAGLVQVIRV